MIFYKCTASATQKWQVCHGDDGLSPDNSNPIRIKLGHFSPNLYLQSTVFFLLMPLFLFFIPPWETAICGFSLSYKTKMKHLHFLFPFTKHPSVFAQSGEKFVVSHVGPRAKCHNSQPEFEQLPQTQWEILVWWRFQGQKILTLCAARSCISRVSVNTHPRSNRCLRRWLQTTNYVVIVTRTIDSKTRKKHWICSNQH